MEKERKGYEIDGSLYQKIKQPKTRDEILSVFEKEEGLQKFKGNNKFTPLYAFYVSFNNALYLHKDLETAEHFFNIFYDDIEQPRRNRIITDLVRSIMDLQKHPDIFILDFVDIVKEKKKTKERHYIYADWMYSEIYYRSKSDNPLLIIGETGTGKGLLANLMHKISDRRKEEFENLNCVTIPKDLLESELFGYEKGGFTGAAKEKPGILEIANKGTVFLDEVGKMPKNLQAKLLKAIEEKEIRRLGSEKTIKIDVRFIAAAQPKDAKHIIPDLLYRLGYPNFFEMPTLEKRLKGGRQVYIKVIEDSLNKAKEVLRSNKDIKISETAYPLLLNHKYEGNFRELENILKSAIEKMSMEMTGRTEIEPQDLIDVLRKSITFYEDKEKSPSDEPNLKNIKLKDIIDYAHQEKIRIIETKINEVKNSGKDIKSVLMNEGLSEKEYLNFRKKVVTITGKGIKEFGL